MAREWGHDLFTTLTVRLTKKDKERLKEAAKRRNMNVSEWMRRLLVVILRKEEEMNDDSNSA